jgi:hypothetical protein
MQNEKRPEGILTAKVIEIQVVVEELRTRVNNIHNGISRLLDPRPSAPTTQSSTKDRAIDITTLEGRLNVLFQSVLVVRDELAEAAQRLDSAT